MCLRVFIATRRQLALTPLFEGEPPPLSLTRVKDEKLASALEALLGGSVVEAGAHTLCACGFNLAHAGLGPWNDVERAATSTKRL
jgi:hypothetical protein